MTFANRIAHLKPEGAYAVLARAQALESQGRDIIHLEIGQPDFETYPHITLAGIRAIAEGKTRYNPPAGVSEFRQVLADDAGARRGVKIHPEQVVVAPGTKPLLLFPLMALISPGDEVIYPDPGFPTYEAAIRLVGATAVPVGLSEERDYDLDLASFDAALSARTRMIILNSPSNPTGSVLSLETLTHVAEAARRLDCWVLSDEIYFRLVYDGESLSIVSLPGMLERTILADGFSKTYAMTGWRLGFGVMPEPVAEKLALLITHSTGCTATFTQYAGIEAVVAPQDDVDRVREEFRQRRALIVQGLNAIPGVRCPMPPGAFYVFPNVEAFGRPARELSDYLLDEAGVAVLPGTDFGASGEGHLRLSYANSQENIRIALERMAHALAKLG